MALLSEFLRDLGSAHFDATVVRIVSDNAKAPNERLRSCMMLHQPLTSSLNKSNVRLSRYNSGFGNDFSARRSLSRYHSEPIVVNPPSSAPIMVVSIDCSRWAPMSPHQQRRDELLVLPQRTRDRWGVTRNHSDSALLSIMPKRSQCISVSKNLISSLERKCSASKVISEMASASRLRSVREDSMEDVSERETEDESSHGSIIEQLIVVPGGSKRREQEGKERFIRSILDVPGRVPVDDAAQQDDDDEDITPAPVCLATRQVLGGLHAMAGFILLVIRIISVELFGPVVVNANVLLQTLVEAMSDPGMGNDLPAVLPLLGFSAGTKKAGNLAQEQHHGCAASNNKTKMNAILA